MPPKNNKKQSHAPPAAYEIEDDEEDFPEEDPHTAALLERLTDPNYSAKFVASLPANVRERVRALQGLQDEFVKTVQQAYLKDLAALDKKYEKEYQPLYQHRAAVIVGEVEPTEEEILAGIPAKHKDLVSITEGVRSDVKGIPDFWLTALKNDSHIRDLISTRDEECLRHLIDIRCVLEENPLDGFTLFFVFDGVQSGKYFEEKCLSKKFLMKQEGSEMVLCKTIGSAITWKAGQNLTVEEKTKKQRSKKTKAFRHVTVSVPCESFFNFFKDEEEDAEKKNADGEDDEDEDDEEEDPYAASKSEEDHEIATTIKDHIIVRAVEFFTGEADSGSDDDDDDFEDDDEEDEEEDDDDDEVPVVQHRGRAVHAHNHKAHGKAGGKKEECTQQ